MASASMQERKRPVNLTLHERLVAEAKTYTSNPSATICGNRPVFVDELLTRSWG